LFGGFVAVGSEEARSTALALASVRRSVNVPAGGGIFGWTRSVLRCG
jgi:hypothetical protein